MNRVHNYECSQMFAVVTMFSLTHFLAARGVERSRKVCAKLMA